MNSVADVYVVKKPLAFNLHNIDQKLLISKSAFATICIAYYTIKTVLNEITTNVFVLNNSNHRAYDEFFNVATTN